MQDRLIGSFLTRNDNIRSRLRRDHYVDRWFLQICFKILCAVILTNTKDFSVFHSVRLSMHGRPFDYL